MWNNFNFSQKDPPVTSSKNKRAKRDTTKESNKISHSRSTNTKRTKSNAPAMTEKDEKSTNITALSCFGDLTDPKWDIDDPNPDIYVLFEQFNRRFFSGKLSGVEIKWSPRMTLCAGICCYEGRGGLCSVKLSLPLLKFRPRSDLINTLLHEMIHAYLFVTKNNRDRDGHGPEFQKHMNRINTEAMTKITIYHSFHDEVRLYQQHWWRCSGPCKNRAPFFGWVKRSMNRAPGPYDRWWTEHKQSCYGTFLKVREPEKKVPLSLQKDGSKRKSNDSSSDIRNFFSPTSSHEPNNNTKPTASNFNIDLDASLSGDESTHVAVVEPFDPPRPSSPIFPGRGHVLGSVNNNLPRQSRLLDLCQPCQKTGKASTSSKTHSKNAQPLFTAESHKSTSSSNTSKLFTSNSKQKLLNELWSPESARNSKKETTTDLLANLPEWRNNLPASDILSGLDRSTAISSSPVDLSRHMNTEVHCPVCSFSTTMAEINDHLNFCLA